MIEITQSKQSFIDYDGFVEKFKPKKTTDDCYTPPEVMEVVNSYVEKRWGIDRSRFVRPFFPGGDYEHAEYPDGCVVVDNPPFSILAKIKRFYLARGVPFFLFCPSMTAFSSFDERCDVIVCDSNITYENGAIVRTAFVTSLPSDYVAESAPDLGDEMKRICDELRHRDSVTRPKYEYPDEVLTAARLQWMAALREFGEYDGRAYTPIMKLFGRAAIPETTARGVKALIDREMMSGEISSPWEIFENMIGDTYGKDGKAD